ncbi:MAG TPA: hypothetical protein VEB18_02045 [Candidatus Paceibacterota bacterium]|nr:hypothetical protein [Candidatus Paceibacterota bacterium]
MATTLRKSLLVGAALIFLLGAVSTWAYMSAPVFVQFGEAHFLAGGQWYTRTQGEGYADYAATKQSLWEAVAGDPNPLHWIPISFDSVE